MTTTAIKAKEKNVVFTCGNCADKIIAANAGRPAVPEEGKPFVIQDSTTCQVHMSPVQFAATVALELTAKSWREALRVPVSDDAVEEPASTDAPPELGPPWSPLRRLAPGLVTKIAADLLVQWSAEDKFASADMIDRAIEVAEILVAKTKGL